MKNTIKYIAMAGVAASTMLATTSCEDQLDTPNPNQLSSASYWKTEDQVASGLVSAFNMFNHNGMYKRHLYVAMNVPSDEMTPNTPFNDFNSINYMSEPATWDAAVIIWQAHYQQITHINRVLSFANKISWSSDEQKNYVVGQAKFLRALAYYDLALIYHTAPLVLDVQSDMSQYYPTSATWLEMWEQIIADFTEASKVLPKSWDEVDGRFKGQKGRPTWGAATAYLAKSYMIRKRGEDNADMLKAKELLKSVVESGQYELVANYFDNFSEYNENNSESIFEVQYSKTGSTVNWGGDDRTADDDCDNWLAAYFMPSCWSDLYATEWVGKEFDVETTKDGKTDPRKYYSVWQSNEAYDGSQKHAGVALTTDCYGTKKTSEFNTEMPYAVAKYTRVRDHANTEEDNTTHGNYINYRLMRYAEVLMLYAESIFKTEGVTNEAVECIDKVRQRADMKTWAEAGINPATVDEAMKQLAHERVVEFAFEGIRWIDILRWGWLYDDDKLMELTAHDDGVNSDEKSTAPYGFSQWSEGMEFMPIPNADIVFNYNLKPNTANSHKASDVDYNK